MFLFLLLALQGLRGDLDLRTGDCCCLRDSIGEGGKELLVWFVETRSGCDVKQVVRKAPLFLEKAARKVEELASMVPDERKKNGIRQSRYLRSVSLCVADHWFNI